DRDRAECANETGSRPCPRTELWRATMENRIRGGSVRSQVDRTGGEPALANGAMMVYGKRRLWRIILIMKVCPFRLTVCFALCCAIAGSALIGQTPAATPIKRIYVEPFTTQEGSDKFREDVIAELRKLTSVSLVSDESSADAILGGGGEVWVKGFRSHNPQLGNVAPNGTAIYTGFLSIELRDTSGDTLWSYLATPPAPSGDDPKLLSPRFKKNKQ